MKSFLLCLVLGACLHSYSQRNIDVLHYRFNIELNDLDDTIRGRAEIKYLAKKGTNSLALQLTGDMFGKKQGMTVTQASIPFGNPYSSNPPNPGTVHTNDRLVITHWTPLTRDDTLLAIVEYKGIPGNGLIISKNKYGKRTFFGDNWPNRAHHWLPCVDDPADKASVEFLVTAPSHYQVVANGVLAEETNLANNKKLSHWKEEVPLPTKVMVIGVAEFAVQHTGNVNGCIPVSSWVFPENKTEGFYDYATASDILAWHIRYIGPYAYKKLANVQSKTMFGGMENAGAIFYYEESVSGKRSEEELQSHEIVHQWFGNSATEKSFAHLWLSEGFATYLTHVYMEARYGTDSLNKRMQADREVALDFVRTSKRPVVDTTSDYMSLLNANSYHKGSWVLHMLRRQVGDPVFHKSIRDYYAQYGGKNADTRDLQKIFESNWGKNLDQFFDQWLYTNENPELDMSWSYDANTKKLSLKITQLQQKLFHFPLDILMVAPSGAAVTAETFINKKEMVVSFSLAEQPVQVSADPFTSLLYSGKLSPGK